LSFQLYFQKRVHPFRDDANAITILDSSDEKDEREAVPTPRENPLPAEMHKTVVGAVVLAVCFILNTLSLVLTHQRQPDRNTTKPLPDIIMDNLPFPVFDDGLYIAEVMIMICVISTLTLVTLHRFR